jgi:FHS family Na+ dependent glucose MFS transporter 1
LTTQTITATRLRPILTTAAYYTAFIGLGLTSAAGGPALPFLAGHTGSRFDQISLIFVTGSFGYLLGSLLGGRAYDRFPGNRIMAAMLVVIAAMCILTPIIPVFWLLAAVLFLLGMAQGSLDVGCNILLMWIHGKKIAPFMNGLHFFFGLGAFISPLIIAQVVAISGDIQWAYWSFAVILVPMAVWLWGLPSPEVHAGTTDRPAKKNPVLPVVLFILFFVMYVGAEVGFGNWIYSYSVKLDLANEIVAAYLTSAFWGFFTLSRLMGVAVSTRLKPRPVLLIDLFGCLASLALVIAWPASATILWVGAIGLGVFMASIFPTLLDLAEERLTLTGSITGWFLVGSGAGGMLVPWLIGQLFERRGPHSTMIIILFAVLADLVLLIVLANLRRPRIDRE